MKTTQRPSLAALALTAPIRIYQKVVPPWLGPCCRFSPSCSHYAVEALRIHGALRGTWLTVWRLLRCQPFAEGGWDPVPGSPAAQSSSAI